jgi:GDPmannose 4,6-dehydratase
MKKRALITGITGQDGSYLAELLLDKGYEVHGIVRQSSLSRARQAPNLARASVLGADDLTLHYGDLADGPSLEKIVAEVKPDEVYNLAAQSHVGESFRNPEHTGEVTGLGTLRLLEAIRKAGLNSRFYQASTSELFGDVTESPQSELTTFRPRSPYAAAKAYALHVTRTYAAAYGMFAVNGILFNHESERRGETFVTRKITRAVGRIKYGLQHEVVLGNMEARRDWGHAEDYVRAMWLMLTSDEPDDYVIGTGETRSVRDFCEAAFSEAGLDWRDHVRTDPSQERPADVELLLADASKAREKLGWVPAVSFRELVSRMVANDLEIARLEAAAAAPRARLVPGGAAAAPPV